MIACPAPPPPSAGLEHLTSPGGSPPYSCSMQDVLGLHQAPEVGCGSGLASQRMLHSLATAIGSALGPGPSQSQ